MCFQKRKHVTKVCIFHKCPLVAKARKNSLKNMEQICIFFLHMHKRKSHVGTFFGELLFFCPIVDQKQIWIVIIFFKVLTHDLSFCSWSEKCSHIFPGSEEVFCYKFKTFSLT